MTSSAQRELVIDTSGFFVSASRLESLRENGKLVTIDLVVFEFVKVMEIEIHEARASKKIKKLEMLEAIRDRMPQLMRALQIDIRSPEFTFDDLLQLQSQVSIGVDPADCMIWLKMCRAGLDSIVTRNSADWKKLGAKVVVI